MDWIAGAVVERAIDTLSVDLGPQPAMHKPFLKPNRLQRSGCNFTQQRGDMWPTKSAKAVLAGIADVRVAIVEWCPESGEYQETMKVGLEKNINMHPLTDVAPVSHVARRSIESIRRLTKPALHGKPGVEVRHVVDAWRGGFDLLIEIVRAEVAVLIEKLRQVWTGFVPGSQPAKQSCWRYRTACFSSKEVSAVKSEISRRCIRYRVHGILRIRHVAQQRHPVVLRNLRCLFPAGEGWSGWLQQRVPIWSFHVKREARLRIS